MPTLVVGLVLPGISGCAGNPGAVHSSQSRVLMTLEDRLQATERENRRLALRLSRAEEQLREAKYARGEIKAALDAVQNLQTQLASQPGFDGGAP